MSKTYCVYILTNRRNGTLYTGVMGNLPVRIWQHKERLVEGFAKRYGLDKLVYYEASEEIESAIAREKQIKGYLRAKKIALIEDTNPEWRDLYTEL